MFVILHMNFAPFRCGDFTFCNTKREVKSEIKNFIDYNEVIAIYDLKGKKDIKRFFKP